MDSLWSFFISEQNLVFLYSVFFMVGLVVLEIGSLLIGLDVGGALDDLIPDIDLDGDSDGRVSVVHAFLGWLHVGRVPIMALLILFLFLFGFTGYLIQFFSLVYLKGGIGTFWVVLVDAALSLFHLNKFGGFVGKLISPEDSSAVSRESFLGKTAVVTVGTARKDMPAEAKFKDEHGKTHYVMVIPIHDEDSFPKGTQVLLVDVIGRNFIVDRIEV